MKNNNMNNITYTLSVDDIIKNYSGEDYDVDSQDMKVDDILNEYSVNNHSLNTNTNADNSLNSSSKYEFNPNLTGENSRRPTNPNIHDEELRKIMEMADDVYKKHDLKLADGDMSKYLGEILNQQRRYFHLRTQLNLSITWRPFL